MQGSNNQRSAMQMQGRKRGIYRESTSGLSQGPGRGGGGGVCKGPGTRQGMQANMPPVEPVVGSNTIFATANLKMLKEQAARMAKALREIEARIKQLSDDDVSEE